MIPPAEGQLCSAFFFIRGWPGFMIFNSNVQQLGLVMGMGIKTGKAE